MAKIPEPPEGKPRYKKWEYVPRSFELYKADGTVVDKTPDLMEKFGDAERRGLRSVQIGINIFHFWRYAVMKRYGEEVAKEMSKEVGELFGRNTGELMRRDPRFNDINKPEYWDAFIEHNSYGSWMIGESSDIVELGPGEMKMRVYSCRQFIPWRDGFNQGGAKLSPDPKTCHEYCDKWWEGQNNAASGGKIKFKRLKSMETDGHCEWDIWLEKK
ncbi:MAG: hypothetical protein HY619_01635 [Thaumarchaeota archaeon]|nr:hypothetical protein [Nitrososphaerota archaeon]